MSLIVCPKCGSPTSDKYDVCPNCGYPLARPVPKKSRGKVLIYISIAIGALVALLVTICILVFALGGKEAVVHLIGGDDPAPAVAEEVAEAAEEVIDPNDFEFGFQGWVDEHTIYANAYDGFVNIRNTPSNKGKILGRFKNGPKGAIKLGEEGEWILIDYDGIEGYVYGKYVSLEPSDPVYVTLDSKWLKGTWTDGERDYIFSSNGSLTIVLYNGKKRGGNSWRLSGYDMVITERKDYGQTETYRLSIDVPNKRMGNLWKWK